MSEKAAPVPQKPTVAFDALEALDIRVGTIESVVDVEDSDKLVKLAVDFGDHHRQVLVGMKRERDDPTEITGLQTLFVLNLEPRTMAGHVSEAMLFDIGFLDGIVPALALPERPVPNGARVG